MRFKREKKRTNRFERVRLRQDKIAHALAGTGRYLYQNNTSGDLALPKPSEQNQKIIAKNGEFIGDSYFLRMVRTNDLRLLKEFPVQENKLITEQPPIVTDKGTVEFVEPKKAVKLNEDIPQEKAPDVLITEEPEGGIVLID